MRPPDTMTGERVFKDRYKHTREDYLIYMFHIAAYKFCLPYVRGRKVLDFGCGSGYGTSFIARDCESVTGIDVSAGAIDYAKEHYPEPNVEFRRIVKTENEMLPFPDNAFDVVLSFQVIEHVKDTGSYLSEARRVLKNDGIFIVATPDRAYRLFGFQKPWNKFHLKEYSDKLLHQLLEPFFSHVEFFRMSGKRDVLLPEFRRTRSIKWLTLPFTFPCAPEWWRKTGISLLKFAGSGLKIFKTQKESEIVRSFDERDIVISKSASPSVNIIAVAAK